MSAGTLARSALGPLFPLVGSAYRRAFVDIGKVAQVVPRLPDGALLLEVGAGDGAVLDRILARQPALRAVALDLAPDICGWVQPERLSRVTVRSATSVREYAAQGESPDAVLLADVFHHVPPPERAQLVREVLAVFGDKPPLVVVKDVDLGGLRSRAAFWADRYISGDRGVVPMPPGPLTEMMLAADPGLQVETTTLYDVDRPNYCLIFRGAASAG